LRALRSAILFLLTLTIVSAQVARSSPPAAENDAIQTCVSDGGFVKIGRMSGLYAMAVVIGCGGSSAGLGVRLFVQSRECPGCGTYDLGTVDGGDHVSLFFAGGYAYVTSALHDFSGSALRLGDCEQCYTHMLVSRLAVRSDPGDKTRKILVDRGIAVVELAQRSDYRHEVERAHFASTARFVNKVLTSAEFIKKI
jgi:hypothetical protein